MNRSLLITFVTACLLLAAAVAGYVALRAVVARQSQTVADLNKAIDVKIAETARLKAVREQLAALAKDEATVAAYFVPEALVVPFIDDLQVRGTALGTTVEIASVSFVPAKGKERPSLQLALSITGAFDPVMRTLGSIEYAPYAISTTNITLAQGEGPGTWRANANFVVGSATASAPIPVPLSAAPVASSTAALATTTPAASTSPKRL